jgi:signal transduction histidine kinase
LWLEFWPEDDQPKAAGALAEATAGRIGRFQGLLHDTAGSSKWWDVQLSPMLNKDGGVDRIIAISREITDIKHAHAALMQSEKFAAAGRLAATIAHEINNPLEAITNLFYLLNTHPSLDDQARHYANLCEQELGRVSHIVKQTLGFYRAVASPTRVRVAEIARNVLGLQRKSLERARVHVIEELWCTDEVFAYTGELRQVILNLVTNATDAMPAGGTLRVRVHASTDPRDNSRHGVRVTVADTGNGIRQEDRARLFQAFFSTKGEKGTGLGLWVTKSIVQKHEGSIRFRSRVGRHHGTAFSVFFPAEPSTIVPRTTRVTTAAIVKS